MSRPKNGSSFMILRVFILKFRGTDFVKKLSSLSFNKIQKIKSVSLYNVYQLKVSSQI